ncbi:phage tail protein [Paracidovorax valerianellae]|uniref:phage tail protein n=1 Tax=Paracidovorax valerianellae TaxID=187868 RepID=UPI0023023CBE|nr:phage tail protein [Paracidovorax valerianellae]MDA8444758.1 phage tail protein [Paracidovorax valerianellae]UYL85514.1 tail protein [Acidovorax phage Alfacinha1]
MWKLPSLRKLIEAAVPDLARDPERLIVMATDGAAVSTLAGGLSFEYRYTAAITVLDYTGHTDALFVPILAWVRAHQSDLLDNPASQAGGIGFTVEHLNTAAVDIGIRVPLTERAIVKADPAHLTRFNVTHPAEPCHPGGQCLPEHWELWLQDKMLAAWDIPAPAEVARFTL